LAARRLIWQRRRRRYRSARSRPCYGLLSGAVRSDPRRPAARSRPPL